jgi:hypothetical protein
MRASHLRARATRLAKDLLVTLASSPATVRHHPVDQVPADQAQGRDPDRTLRRGNHHPAKDPACPVAVRRDPVRARLAAVMRVGPARTDPGLGKVLDKAHWRPRV